MSKGGLTVSRLLISGFDIVPVPRTETRGDGTTTTYELYHARSHMLGAEDGRVTHSTILVSPARALGQAMSSLEDEINEEPRAVPGSEVDMERIQMQPRRFRFWRPDPEERAPRRGIVVGHMAVYHPAERIERHQISAPQVIRVVALLVKQEDGSSRTIHARMYPPGEKILERGKSPTTETYYTWQMLRRAFPMDTEVAYVPQPGRNSGYYRLEGEDMAAMEKRALTLDVKSLINAWGGNTSPPV
jgi:hypothetical protein